ncbi:protease SohB [Oceaniserpentilla sp. 4NH20-0058]|uniref:protease SohB n=1 Tax=Oceaniserpentilla sp. 4NH20-0058 TaxID=3127660 RepID=UPI003104FFBC
MEFLSEYGLFLAKSATFVVVVAIIIGLIASVGQKAKPEKLTVEHLNDKLDKLKKQLQSEVLTKKQLKELAKKEKTEAKAKEKSLEVKEKVYVLNFNGDIKASQSEHLKDEITALLSLNDHIDEVVVKVESGGGMVHQYGYAASQLDRIKSQGIPLTICVDKVAASGGYMMAVVADKIIAAPFAIIGSIGVIAQLPNFNKLLKKHDVDFEVHTAGEYKRTLTLFGENTDKAREKFKEDLKDVHVLFKNFISSHRDNINLDEVANGDVWYGQDAIKQSLIDEVSTSDDYLLSRCQTADVYLLKSEEKKPLLKRLGASAQEGISTSIEKTIEKLAFTKWYL